MSTRRLQRLVLGASTGGFQSIQAMEFLLHSSIQKHHLVRQFCECFLPSLRYVNPSLSIRFLELPPRQQEEEAPKTAKSSSVTEVPTSPGGSPEKPGISSRRGSSGDPAIVTKDCVRLFFGEGNGAHVINLQLYSHPHQLMQRLLDLDSRWQQLQSLASPSQNNS
ncbi:hypothetical protein CSUI_001675 [Cystoisospora suis]|uniref:Uncharacterized protein n=1 Tax=Cystoisospora suis TaxID=483139 RepID=A0A2C6LBZ3_9APIC|nr:hypothetical protein CSUI_001675 [Cystoisospora suis]